MLEDVYDAQRSLNLRTVGFDVCAIGEETERLLWFRNYLTAWDQELKELLESLDAAAAAGGRSAAASHLDVQNVKVEIVDMLHFLVSLFQVMGEPAIRDSRVPGGEGGLGPCLERIARDHEASFGIALPAGPTPEQMNRLLVLHGVRAAVETGRVLDTVRWKWWARQANRWDEALEALYTRLLPGWCHLVIASGMDEREVVDLYMRKNRLNFERQEGGYREGTYRKQDGEGREDNLKLFED